MNSMVICGNASEPQLRYTQSGQAMATFAVFVKRKVKEEWVSTPVNVKAWGDLAENIAAEILKGDRVLVSGRVEEESWTDKESGAERTKLVLVADEAGRSLRWGRKED